MITKGAKHLLLLSRRGSTQGEVGELIRFGQDNGVSVEVQSCDVADRQQVVQVVKRLASRPPIRGLIHAAMVMDVRQASMIPSSPKKN